jgi:hypothetical protein
VKRKRIFRLQLNRLLVGHNVRKRLKYKYPWHGISWVSLVDLRSVLYGSSLLYDLPSLTVIHYFDMG